MPPAQIDELRKKLNALDLNGAKVVPFRADLVMDRAFFPGGNGLYMGRTASIPVAGTLVLGSNFGRVPDFIRGGSLVRSDETQTSNTWKGLYRMLSPETKIKLERCFFTNAWPFLHEGNSNETKGLISAWLADTRLMKTCVGFFKETLSVVQPKLIVALGTGAPALLSRLWPEELGEWSGSSIASMDAKPIAMVNSGGNKIICTAITHPSHSNSRQRRPPYQDTEGEIRLLAEAALLAQLELQGPKGGAGWTAST